MITGGTVFISSHLVNALYHNRYEVIILHNLLNQVYGNIPSIQSLYFKALFTKARFGSITRRNDSKFHPASVYGITKQNQVQFVLNLKKEAFINKMTLSCFPISHKNFFVKLVNLE